MQRVMAECHYPECHYAECRLAECNYAECRGAPEKRNIAKKTKNVIILVEKIS
jgi:hypothetical protein